MLRMKLVSVIALAAVVGLASANTASGQWGGCHHPPVHRSYSVGYGPGWNSSFHSYRAGFVGVPGYYRSAGFYGVPRAYVAPRFVPVPVYPVNRPVIVAPGWTGGFGPGWGPGFGPGWGPGFGPGWGGSGVSLRVGF